MSPAPRTYTRYYFAHSPGPYTVTVQPDKDSETQMPSSGCPSAASISRTLLVTGGDGGTNPSIFPTQNVKLRVKCRAVLSEKVFLALHRLYTVR